LATTQTTEKTEQMIERKQTPRPVAAACPAVPSEAFKRSWEPAHHPPSADPSQFQVSGFRSQVLPLLDLPVLLTGIVPKARRLVPVKQSPSHLTQQRDRSFSVWKRSASLSFPIRVHLSRRSHAETDPCSSVVNNSPSPTIT
jgi:hypothetical protein